MVTIRDPIHGDLHFSGVLAELIETQEFQRLCEVKQLGLTDQVFPGATHTRYAHSIGACHLAGELAERLEVPARDAILIQVAALLHDIGHYDFSHALERFAALGHEENGRRIIRGEVELPLRECGIAKALLRHGIDPEEIVALLEGSRGRPKFHSSILASDVIDVDRMDYLKRDTYYTGAMIGEIDIGYLLRSLIEDPETGELAIRAKGIATLEQFLVARLHMHQQVYQHRNIRITELMLQKAVELSLDVAAPLLHGDGILLGRLAERGCAKTRALVRRIRAGRGGLFEEAFALDAQGDFLESWQSLAGESAQSVERSLLERTGLENGDILVFLDRKWETCKELPRFRARLRSGSMDNLFAISPLSRAVYEEQVSKVVFGVYCSCEHKDRVRAAAQELVKHG